VRKSVSLPGNPDSNLGGINPIASGFIQTDAINRTGDPVGMYTWYRLSHFEGSPNIQGVELREYLLGCRDVSSGPNASFQLAIPEGGFNPNYSTAKLLYTDMAVKNPGAGGPTTWSIVFGSTLSYVQISTSNQANLGPSGQSFFFYVVGM
jgi:hypothetical protein